MFKIYIASSWRNLHYVRAISYILERMGCEMLDWSHLAPPLPDTMPPEERRRLFDSDQGGEIFDFCRGACGGLADLVIYLGPAGQDAAAELGIAHASGVPVYGLASPLETPGLIVSGCVSRWFRSPEDLLAATAELVEAWERGQACA